MPEPVGFEQLGDEVDRKNTMIHLAPRKRTCLRKAKLRATKREFFGALGINLKHGTSATH